jgi:hypothetical protein
MMILFRVVLPDDKISQSLEEITAYHSTNQLWFRIHTYWVRVREILVLQISLAIGNQTDLGIKRYRIFTSF